MKVRFIKEMFGLETYDLNINDKGLVFSNKNNQISILYEDIKYFSLEGKNKKTKRFTLETKTLQYEGNFLLQDDADEFVHKISEKCNCYFDLRMEIV